MRSEGSKTPGRLSLSDSWMLTGIFSKKENGLAKMQNKSAINVTLFPKITIFTPSLTKFFFFFLVKELYKIYYIQHNKMLRLQPKGQVTQKWLYAYDMRAKVNTNYTGHYNYLLLWRVLQKAVVEKVPYSNIYFAPLQSTSHLLNSMGFVHKKIEWFYM